jgi:hypothetical protein
MWLRRLPWKAVFEHLFHENDAASRRIHLLAEFSIRGASGEAKTAVYASLHGASHVRAEGAEFFWLDGVQHFMRPGPESGLRDRAPA